LLGQVRLFDLLLTPRLSQLSQLSQRFHLYRFTRPFRSLSRYVTPIAGGIRVCVFGYG
jgi:hypothetical protein